MNVPGVVVAVGDLRPDDFHDAGARFDEAASEHQALAECIPAVTITDIAGLLIERERIAGAARSDQRQGLIVVLVQVQVLHRPVDFRHPGINHLAQLGPPLQPLAVDIGPHFEVFDPDASHLLHVHIVPLRIEGVRIERLAEEAGRAALADDVALLQRTRQHHERQHRHLGRQQPDDVRTEVREVLRRRRFELARWADLVGRVAGHHLIDGSCVVEEAVGGIAHRADEGRLVEDVGDVRQHLGDLDAGEFGVDRLEDRLHIVRDVLLGIPQVEMAGATLEIAQDDALGLAPAGSACGERVRLRLSLEHGSQSETEHR